VSETALQLLRLLAQDAPAERIEEQAAALAAADPSASTVARDLALRVRAGIDAHQRREAELSALVETARDLASRSDTRAVLDAIVRRARTLLGTDVAYLTLSDPERGDTFMRATAGSVSARFQTLRLPTGAGLGGLVAQTRRPYWTADYPADLRFRHTSEIDAAVGEEGLVAICGTPLLVDGQFVGVLFASNRSRRPFQHDEVALLGSLAALAAVSLVQTQRATETAAALDALSHAHTAIEQAAAVHDRFVAVVLGGGGVDDIAATLGELLGCWVVALDADAQRLATHGPAPTGDPDPVASSPAVRRSAATGRITEAGGSWAVAVTAAGQRLGTLVLGGLDGLDDGQGRTVERAAMVTALVLLFTLRAAEADQRVRTDLLADLLAFDQAGDSGAGAGADSGTGADEAALVERGRLLGIRMHAPHVLVVCRSRPVRPRGLLLAAARAGSGRGLAGVHGGAVVGLVPGTDPGTVARALAQPDADGDGPVTVGAAGPVSPIRGLRAAHSEATRVAAALLALGLRGHGGTLADLGFAGLVAGDTPDVDGYLDRVLGPVLDYDQRRGSDLAGTLDVYFGCGTSPRRAAGELHLHPNTVAQRLDRIAGLLGADWQQPDRALEIQLALKLRRLRRP
jgi:type II secretory pathway pseudopilin PulG